MVSELVKWNVTTVVTPLRNNLRLTRCKLNKEFRKSTRQIGPWRFALAPRAICQTYRLWRIKRTSATPLLKRVSERLARTFFRLTARSLSIFPPDDAGTGPELRRRATGHNRGSSRPLVWGVGAGSWRRIASRPSAVLRRPLGWAKKQGPFELLSRCSR